MLVALAAGRLTARNRLPPAAATGPVTYTVRLQSVRGENVTLEKTGPGTPAGPGTVRRGPTAHRILARVLQLHAMACCCGAAACHSQLHILVPASRYASIWTVFRSTAKPIRYQAFSPTSRQIRPLSPVPGLTTPGAAGLQAPRKRSQHLPSACQQQCSHCRVDDSGAANRHRHAQWCSRSCPCACRALEPKCERVGPAMPYECVECRPGYWVKAGACAKVCEAGGRCAGTGLSGQGSAEQHRVCCATASSCSAPKPTAGAGCAVLTPHSASAAHACRTTDLPAEPVSPALTMAVRPATASHLSARSACQGGAWQQAASALDAAWQAVPAASWTAKAARFGAYRAGTHSFTTWPTRRARHAPR